MDIFFNYTIELLKNNVVQILIKVTLF